jgi:hypothetical protein
MIYLRRYGLGLAVCIVLLSTPGCGNKEAQPQKADSTSYPASVEPQNHSAIVAESQTASAQSATAVVPQVVQNPAVVQPGSEMSTVLAQLTQAVRRYGAEKQKVPASVNEVLGAGYVQGTPQPPAGKKFAIDPKRLEVMLVNQ